MVTTRRPTLAETLDLNHPPRTGNDRTNYRAIRQDGRVAYFRTAEGLAQYCTANAVLRREERLTHRHPWQIVED